MRPDGYAGVLASSAPLAQASLGDWLIAALQAGLAAGGEVSPVRSAGLVIAESVPWPVTDLRVDWHEDPVAELTGLWQAWHSRRRRPTSAEPCTLRSANGIQRHAHHQACRYDQENSY